MGSQQWAIGRGIDTPGPEAAFRRVPVEGYQRVLVVVLRLVRAADCPLVPAVGCRPVQAVDFRQDRAAVCQRVQAEAFLQVRAEDFPPVQAAACLPAPAAGYSQGRVQTLIEVTRHRLRFWSKNSSAEG
jgi:hypothetical protein